MQLAEISRNPRSPAATGGGFQTWADRIRLSENVAFWQTVKESRYLQTIKMDNASHKVKSKKYQRFGIKIKAASGIKKRAQPIVSDESGRILRSHLNS